MPMLSSIVVGNVTPKRASGEAKAAYAANGLCRKGCGRRPNDGAGMTRGSWAVHEAICKGTPPKRKPKTG